MPSMPVVVYNLRIIHPSGSSSCVALPSSRNEYSIASDPLDGSYFLRGEGDKHGELLAEIYRERDAEQDDFCFFFSLYHGEASIVLDALNGGQKRRRVPTSDPDGKEKLVAFDDSDIIFLGENRLVLEALIPSSARPDELPEEDDGESQQIPFSTAPENDPPQLPRPALPLDSSVTAAESTQPWVKPAYDVPATEPDQDDTQVVPSSMHVDEELALRAASSPAAPPEDDEDEAPEPIHYDPDVPMNEDDELDAATRDEEAARIRSQARDEEALMFLKPEVPEREYVEEDIVVKHVPGLPKGETTVDETQDTSGSAAVQNAPHGLANGADKEQQFEEPKADVKMEEAVPAAEKDDDTPTSPLTPPPPSSAVQPEQPFGEPDPATLPEAFREPSSPERHRGKTYSARKRRKLDSDEEEARPKTAEKNLGDTQYSMPDEEEDLKVRSVRKTPARNVAAASASEKKAASTAKKPRTSQAQQDVETPSRPGRKRGVLSPPTTSLPGASYEGKPPRIVLSSSDVDHEKEVKSFLASSAAKIVDDISAAASTHLVVGGDGLKRTSKLVVAIALGKPVVHENWLRESAKAGHLLDITSFLARDEERERDWACDLSRAAGKPRTVLDEHTVYFTPALLKSLKASGAEGGVVQIIKAAGGTSVRKPPAKSQNPSENELMLGSEKDDEDVKTWNEHGWTLYRQELVILGVLRGKLELENDEFVIKSGDATGSEAGTASQRSGRGSRRSTRST
ncbi:hypothetical protein SAICODRAFT_26429 [Saitoella complicata NRRL Y-17804]|uniref:BRCT domain-containing protein n=1 Tax=Saitoella complicata (strain BCRC 22490 / CBS 7301 / JCM 7358 / NBRC 10748 / NRRL Y-17804) TaxID=698492 RepID=A0A0E9NR48_SAICN|nr:uncharacterized protein SAICODRAFT_26429 [Saitoella complicata NRRL Y-17804]ODQ51669.1 hypothetical protein SAICODRAFT_26429 [Saitoella complicata NRRL Y-17804]GAO52278.1 hypothetical protein G7K_6358-t1 [Saitoella complicata NRRL Y-17804]